MKRKCLIISLLALLLVSCGGDGDDMLSFDEAIVAFEAGGYPLESINVNTGRCYKHSFEEGTDKEVTYRICSSKKNIDAVFYLIGIYSTEEGRETMIEQLDMIGFPHTDEVVSTYDKNIVRFITGNQIRIRNEVGDWSINGWLVEARQYRLFYYKIENKDAP